MERALSPDEKIRRAEEIYYKRKLKEENRSYARVPIEGKKKDITLLKKMIFQILICIVIYTAFYTIKNKEYIFSENVISKTKYILSYDINILKSYEEIKEYLNSFTYNNVDKKRSVLQEESINLTENNNETIEETTENVEGIGGENIGAFQEEQVALTQMEQDANDISKTKSIILPLKGTITSRFGIRESQNPIVSKNHTGIDIAVNEGTVFIAAMDGVVKEVSDVRRAGKSHKNYKWRC